VDELLQQQNELTDKAERAALLIEAQALIAEDSPIIPVSNPGWPLAVNKRVQGAEVGPLWYWASLFKNVWVTE
jgi:ABC-type transport system substrate-binding protein